MNDEDKKALEKRIAKIRKTVPQYITKLEKSDDFAEEHNLVMEYTSFMDGHGFDYDMRTRLYFILHGMRDFPKCCNPNCGKPVIHHRNITAIDYEYAYPMFCSKECKYHQDEQRKRNEAAIEYRRRMDARTDEECLRDLKAILEVHPLYPHKYLKSSAFNDRLIDFVFEKTRKLDDAKFEPTLSTRLYWAVNGLSDYPKCRCCGRPMDDKNIYSYATGYPLFCSNKCENEASDKLKKEYYGTFTEEDLIKLSMKDEAELLDDLKKCLEEEREYAKKVLRPGEKWHYLYKFIMDSTDFLDDFYTMKTRIFYILHGWKEERRCAECDKIIRKNMRSIYEKFPDFCSVKCSKPTASKKSIATLQSKYGEDCKYSFNIPGLVERNVAIRKANFEARKKVEYEERQNKLQPYQRDDAEYWSLSKEQKQMFVDELRELTFEHSEMYARTIMAEGGKKHYLYKLIQQATSPLLSEPFYTFPTKVWFVLNGVKRYPRCLQCGKRLDHRNLNMWSRGYPRFCCPSCGTMHEETQSKMQKTCMEVYGVKNPMQNTDIQQLMKNTLFERYGTYNIFDNEVFEEKRRQTCRERYGCDFSMQSEEVKRKARETNLKKYGVEIATQNPTIRKKIINTFIERFGVDNPQKNKEIHAKTIQTSIERYGTINPMQNRDVFIKSVKKYLYNGIRFHSSWELAYYIWLHDNNIDFEYQPDICFKYVVGGKEHNYFPDFRCGDKVIEIKGNHFFDKDGVMINPFKDGDNEKYKMKQKCMTDNGVVLMKEVDIKPYLKYVKDKYGRDYLKRFRIE